MNNQFCPKVDSTDFVIQELDNELMLYKLSNNRAFALNQTSAFIWQNSTGSKTVEQIAAEYSKQLDQTVPVDLVWLTLDRLQIEDLITITDDSMKKELSFKRRDLLKKIGLTTIIALPAVSSIVAPTSVSAQSGNILQQCSVCLTKTHEFTLCADVCQDIVVGDCHDNAGCGMGIFLQLVTCGQCLGNLPPNGNPSTISWHGTQYKNP